MSSGTANFGRVRRDLLVAQSMMRMPSHGFHRYPKAMIAPAQL